MTAAAAQPARAGEDPAQPGTTVTARLAVVAPATSSPAEVTPTAGPTDVPEAAIGPTLPSPGPEHPGQTVVVGLALAPPVQVLAVVLRRTQQVTRRRRPGPPGGIASPCCALYSREVVARVSFTLLA